MGSRVENPLVVFDVEGVLIPKSRFILFEVAGRMGPGPFVKAAILGLLYEMGLMSVKRALEKLYRLLEGLSLEQFTRLFLGLPFMPSVESVFRELKEAGFRIALISSGVPRIVLEKMNAALGADYVSGPEIGVSEGRLSGEIWGDVVEPQGKAAALRKIISDEGLSPGHCIGVADDRNNAPMFQLCDVKIGYNPDYVLSYKSDHVVTGDLSEIIPIVKGERVENRSPDLPRSSIMRETIHVGGFLVPFACTYVADRYIVAASIFLVTAIYAISEIARMYGMRFPIVSHITSKAARKSEFQEFVASPIFYALGIVMSLVFFPEPLGYASIAVLTLGDGFASILGKKIGKKTVRFNKKKRYEGTVCGIAIAFLGSLIFVDPTRALVASTVGMLVEVFPLPVNDNLAIPLASGLALTALTP